MNISQSPNLEQHEKDDIDFIQRTLIPDLRESDSDLTADDFQRCIDLIERLDARLTVITKLLPAVYAVDGKLGSQVEDALRDALTLADLEV